MYAPLADARGNAGTVGTDSFQITATDQHHGIVTKTVTVAISPSEQAAVVEPAAAKKPGRRRQPAPWLRFPPPPWSVRVSHWFFLRLSGRYVFRFHGIGGKALLMKSNGTASTTLSLPKSTSLVIRAKGDQYKGAPDHDRVPSTAAVSDDRGVGHHLDRLHDPDHRLGGTHTISVAYTNELRASASRDLQPTDRHDHRHRRRGGHRTTRVFSRRRLAVGSRLPPMPSPPTARPGVSYLSAPGKRVANMYNYGVALIPSSAITTSTPATTSSSNTSDPGVATRSAPYTVALPGTKIPAGSDGHIAILDPITGQAFGIWQAKYNTKTDTWTGSWGGGPHQRQMASTRRVRPPPPESRATPGGHRRGVQHRRRRQHRPQPRPGLFHRHRRTRLRGPSESNPTAPTWPVWRPPSPRGYRVQLDPPSTSTPSRHHRRGKSDRQDPANPRRHVVDQGGARMAFIFETIPGATANNPGAVCTWAGLSWDYYDMNNIPGHN